MIDRRLVSGRSPGARSSAKASTEHSAAYCRPRKLSTGANDPPNAGWQFFIARVTATYAAAGSDRFEAAYRLRTVGAAAVSYSGFENSCGEVPDELSEAELFTGGTLTGNVCWAIRSSDAASLVLYDAPVQTVPKRIFLSLH